MAATMAGSLTLLTLVKSPFPAYRILDGNITCSFRRTWRVRTRSGPLGTLHRRRPTSRPGTHGAGIRAAEGAKPGHPSLENGLRQGTPCFYELSGSIFTHAVHKILVAGMQPIARSTSGACVTSAAGAKPFPPGL